MKGKPEDTKDPEALPLPASSSEPAPALPMESLPALENTLARGRTSLDRFYQEIRRIPRLTREEEEELARRWREHKDFRAAQRLILANLYAVAAIAREYRHFGLPEEDLIQEGVLGLMHAVKRFDPSRGFRLMTYASWWIRAAIHDYILRSWSIVKVGTNKLQRRIFAGLQKAKHAIAAIEGRNLEEVAEHYGISAAEYHGIANLFLQRDVSLDAENEDGTAMIRVLPAPGPTPEEEAAEREERKVRSAQLAQAMQRLTDRERTIIERRHLADEPATLKELAQDFGVSIERVRQLEARALRKLRAAMRQPAPS